MVSKVNLKARIERHSRILKDNLGIIHPFRSLYHKINHNFVLGIVIFLFPVYPLFSSYFYENSVVDFYRGNIDESSIIEHYIDENDDSSYLVTSDNAFLSVNTIATAQEVKEQRDTSGYKKIMEYEIKSGDSLYGIAKKFGVSKNTILWTNDMTEEDLLKPGKVLKIPPVSWVIHKVKSWDTIGALALKYKAESKYIYEQNGLLNDTSLKAGEYVIIPWGSKEIPKPKPPKVDPLLAVKNNASQKDNKTPAKTTSSPSTNKNTPPAKTTSTVAKATGGEEYADDVYDIRKRSPEWSFVWGNCTRYVAQYKKVDWSGNAKEWLANARAKWHPTGSKPAVGSIVVFNGSGYNPRYGHVGIVIDIKDQEIIVKDMNYRRLNEVTVRKVDKDDRAIRGYIYVD